ncbi:MAG: hypothetical protein AABY01_04525, partial [Nanoarchaeota archaeon]
PEKHKLGAGVEVISSTGLDTYGEDEVDPAPMPGGKKREKQKAQKSKMPPEMIAQLTAEASEKPQTPETLEDATIVEARKAAAEEMAAANQEDETPAITDEQIDEIAQDIASGKKTREFGGKGMFPKGVPESVEKKIDERVDAIVHGEPAEKEQDSQEGKAK